MALLAPDIETKSGTYKSRKGLMLLFLGFWRKRGILRWQPGDITDQQQILFLDLGVDFDKLHIQSYGILISI